MNIPDEEISLEYSTRRDYKKNYVIIFEECTNGLTRFPKADLIIKQINQTNSLCVVERVYRSDYSWFGWLKVNLKMIKKKITHLSRESRISISSGTNYKDLIYADKDWLRCLQDI